LQMPSRDRVIRLFRVVSVILFAAGIANFVTRANTADKTYMSENALSPLNAAMEFDVLHLQEGLKLAQEYQAFQASLPPTLSCEGWSL